ncbi:MAG: FAD-dependent oxidoreductase [Rhodospirillaceae bacterium]|nr:MAG: FAD-dependent oxidoreductase [Rhodospirillaceae bacterium]
MANEASWNCDVLVIGTGAGGMTAAVTAAKAGLKVLIVEKDAVFGGTSATSGGMLWIPGSKHSSDLAKVQGVTDSVEKARAYIIEEAGNYLDLPRVDAYLTYGPEMVDFLERETEVKFYGMEYPDYHSENAHASTVRSIGSVDYQAARLGAQARNLKGHLPQTLFLGFAIGSSVEMKQFMHAGRSVSALWFVFKKICGHFRDVIKYGHSAQLVRGRALIGRLAATAFNLGIPIWLSSPARDLIIEDGKVGGAVIETPTGVVRVTARRAVVLASGGFPCDPERRKTCYPPVAERTNRRSVAAPGNTGDGARLGEAAGAKFVDAVSNVAAWMPLSVMPGREGFAGVWPHLVDRNKPGFIAVLKNGKRFTDEAASYQDFVPALIRACENDKEAWCYLICDQRALNRYGMGFVRPFPVPRAHHIRSGYLLRGKDLADLAAQAGIDAANLEQTVQMFNTHAAEGRDPAFGRGARLYDIYQGDDEHKPNPCIGPLDRPPYFAVKIVPGEIGTFAGLKTDIYARVLTGGGVPIPRLYAVGNDQASVWGGAYPGAGATLGPGMTFGYVAGRHIAGLLLEKPERRAAATA